ncbi:MAG TPA: thioredoxin family protein [Opitutaceae bacterium]|nr:thioredoxin family protein [Opitutaceae bacterium]
MKKAIRSLLVFGLVVCGAGLANAREWTIDGTTKVTADFSGIIGDVVFLNKADGSRQKVHLASLSAEDQTFIQNREDATTSVVTASPPPTEKPRENTAYAWLTDFAAAKQQAANENKKMLLDFTGSDWCYFCKKLDAEVLSTPAFKDFAKDYVLVLVDFPRSHELSPDLKNQNKALAQQYRINGFPTLVELSSSGQEIARQSGYHPGSGPQAYIAQFK